MQILEAIRKLNSALLPDAVGSSGVLLEHESRRMQGFMVFRSRHYISKEGTSVSAQTPILEAGIETHG